MSNEPAGGSAPGPDNTATAKIPLAPPSGDREPPVSADDFQPDVPAHEFRDVQSPADVNATAQISTEEANGTTPMPASGRPPSDYAGDPTRESLPFDVPREPPIEAATSDEDVHLIPGAVIGGGRYRLLVFHGGPPTLQFWQALDTALDRQVALTFVDPDATLSDDAVAEDPGAHSQAEPTRHARRRPGSRRRQHRIGRSGGVRVDSRRIPGRGRRNVTLPDRRRAGDPIVGGRGRGGPPRRVLRCRLITPAACG